MEEKSNNLFILVDKAPDCCPKLLLGFTLRGEYVEGKRYYQRIIIVQKIGVLKKRMRNVYVVIN